MAHILVAEDERDIRELLNITLSVIGGHTVTLVNDGEEAVRAAGELSPDLILLDMRMPRMTGLEACRALKAQPGTASIPVVFLSGRGLDDEVQSGLDAGALAFIVKPFAPDELVSEIEQLLARVG
ncbi:MAG: response regulator [Anaerolineae bacterium]|jgi:CheY-like chemotaxis protein|nr:response regulator [Anaerolineae bacterium]